MPASPRPLLAPSNDVGLVSLRLPDTVFSFRVLHALVESLCERVRPPNEVEVIGLLEHLMGIHSPSRCWR